MEWTRRRALAAGLGGAVTAGAARAIYNVFIGYGLVTGTNLLKQDLDPLVSEKLWPSRERVATPGAYEIGLRGGEIRVVEGARLHRSFDPRVDDPADAAAADAELGFEDGPLEQLVADLGALDAGDVRFEYGSYPDFFALLAERDPRPYTVQALRGRRSADPSLVREFADADPADPEALVEGLADGFRGYAGYDFERYVAGSVEDNVLLGKRDLRKHFESETDFEALLAGDVSGLFCNELTRRSVDAFQAVPAPDQRGPVLAGFVVDSRHKHVYTIVASAVRGADDELVIPVTFLDYTDVTQNDDLRIDWLIGDGLDAYHKKRRATRIGWYR